MNRVTIRSYLGHKITGTAIALVIKRHSCSDVVTHFVIDDEDVPSTKGGRIWHHQSGLTIFGDIDFSQFTSFEAALKARVHQYIVEKGNTAFRRLIARMSECQLINSVADIGRISAADAAALDGVEL